MIHLIRSENPYIDFNEIDEIGNIRDILWKPHHNGTCFSSLWLDVSKSEHEIRSTIRDELGA